MQSTKGRRSATYVNRFITAIQSATVRLLSPGITELILTILRCSGRDIRPPATPFVIWTWVLPVSTRKYLSRGRRRALGLPTTSPHFWPSVAFLISLLPASGAAHSIQFHSFEV